MIRVENLSKNYGPVRAVRSISFDLDDGQVIGFLGANGAGKSTTLKIMTGYISPTAGNVYYNDHNIQENTSEIQKDIGYLPELNTLYGEMRVHDYLKFLSEIRGIPKENFNLNTRKSGSAALDMAYVGAGRYDGYFQKNLNIWDIAAGILIVKEAGGKINDIKYSDDKEIKILAGSISIYDKMLEKLINF